MTLDIKKINFEKSQGLVPAIVQDDKNKAVMMLGFMNEEALLQTMQTGHVTFYSRSKNRLWTKGETSGHYLNVKDMTLDCDNDTVLIRAVAAGPTCHTGATTCFGETDTGIEVLSDLESVINQRKQSPEENSYTSSLFSEGLSRISQKVGEEAVETVIAAMTQDNAKLKEESADLIFHLLVLLREKNISLSEVIEVLRARHCKKSNAK